MKITDLAVQVSKLEGKKRQVDIAQIKEVLRCINAVTEGRLYTLIRSIK